MKQNKGMKKLIIILIIAILLLLIVAGVAFAYFKTDIFKTDKELFFKYGSQMFEKEKGFIDEDLLNYYKKQQEQPFKNNGILKTEISSSEKTIEDQYKNTNNMDITFEGEFDNKDSKFEENISINYSDSVKFPVSIKKVNNSIGLQTKYIGANYITLDIDNLNQFSNQIEQSASTTIDTSSNDSSFQLSNILKGFNINTTENGLKSIKEKYLDILNNSLSNEKFSKVQEDGKVGYKLALNADEQKNVIVRLLETLRDDNTTLDLLNENINLDDTSKITSSDINDMIENVKNDTNIKDISIVFYQKDSKLTKISIENKEEKINIEKIIVNNGIQYDLTLENTENEYNINLSAKYEGLQSGEINENYELKLSGNISDNINSNSITSSINDNQISSEETTIKQIVKAVETNKLSEENVVENIKVEDINKAIEEEGFEKISVTEGTNGNSKIEFSETGDVFEVDSKGNIVLRPGEEDSDEQDSELSTQKQTYSYTYKINNNVSFEEMASIEEFNKDNSMDIINDYDNNSRSNLIEAIIERITLVNEKQMESLGLRTTENPIINMFPLLFLTNMSNNNQSSDISNTSENIEENGTEDNSLQNAAIAAFNNKYEKYEGNNLTGATVKGLLTEISNYNGLSGDDEEGEEEEITFSSDYLIEEINFNGEEYKEITEQTISALKNEIKVEDKYKVEFEKKADTGAIYRVVINKK